MKTRKATITLEIPVVSKEEKGTREDGTNFTTFPVTYDVKGFINIIERQLANYISTSRQIPRPEKGTRWDEAMFMLRELKKFYLADEAKVKTLPEIEK